MTNILIINFGSTSSKFVVYRDGEVVSKGSYEHSREELSQYEQINDQIPMRKRVVMEFIKSSGIKLEDLTAIIGRAGGTAPIHGVYRVNPRMVDKLLYRSPVRHVANLCCVIGYELAKSVDIPCYTSSFTEDSMLDICKISGLPQIRRSNEGHMENWYAVARKAAEQLGKSYESSSMIVAHMGGGTTIGLHQNGKIIDVIGDTEGAFGPERSGGLPISAYLEMVLSGKYGDKELMSMMRGRGGLYAYTGTTDAREVEKKIQEGDKDALCVYKAMALQEAKAIASLAVTAGGKIDCIALSGGLANSKMFTEWIREYVSFIAPVYIFPGEFEMEAMYMSVLEVIEGRIKEKEYTAEIDC